MSRSNKNIPVTADDYLHSEGKTVCPHCHKERDKLSFVALRFNMHQICIVCVVLKPYGWITKYVTGEEQYRVFNAQAYPAENMHLRDAKDKGEIKW